MVNTTGFNSNVTIGSGADAVCKAMQQPYADPFSILALANTRNGSSFVHGEPCDIWFGSLSPDSWVSACIGADGVPREMNQSFGGQESSMIWSDIKVEAPPEIVFMPSEACISNYPTKACQAGGTEVLKLYRIHSPAEPFSLENRNLGDALGDMAFTCATDGSGLGDGSSSVVTLWEVEVSLSYGQYGYCLYNHVAHSNYCLGGTGQKVGRESANGLGFGHLQGQCSPNLDVGSWFSFPSHGHCGKAQRIGTNGCTWGNEKRLRTVNASCIMVDQGLQATCKSEYGHAPFRKSAAIFEAALASSDPTKGGCADVATVAESIVV
jgi:hypothetical protein